MTLTEFSAQMERLVSQYGKTAYSDERIQLFFQEVKHLPAWWWKETVSTFISTMRTVPLMTEIREQIALERERQWVKEKIRYAEGSKEFFTYSLPAEEVPTLMGPIIQRVLKTISEEKWEGHVKLLDSFGDSVAGKGCPQCKETGIVHQNRDGCSYIFKCTCLIGRRDTRAYPTYRGER